MYEKNNNLIYKGTGTKKSVLVRISLLEYSALWLNGKHFSAIQAHNYVDYLGETIWKIVDDGIVCKAINKQPALSETTILEFWM